MNLEVECYIDSDGVLHFVSRALRPGGEVGDSDGWQYLGTTMLIFKNPFSPELKKHFGFDA